MSLNIIVLLAGAHVHTVLSRRLRQVQRLLGDTELGYLCAPPLVRCDGVKPRLRREERPDQARSYRVETFWAHTSLHFHVAHEPMYGLVMLILAQQGVSCSDDRGVIVSEGELLQRRTSSCLFLRRPCHSRKSRRNQEAQFIKQAHRDSQGQLADHIRRCDDSCDHEGANDHIRAN